MREWDAGRDFDRWLALNIGGWKWEPESGHPRGCYRLTMPLPLDVYQPASLYWCWPAETDWIERARVPHYSTDMNAAYDLAECFITETHFREYRQARHRISDTPFGAGFRIPKGMGINWPPEDITIEADASTPALALCRALAKAHEYLTAESVV